MTYEGNINNKWRHLPAGANRCVYELHVVLQCSCWNGAVSKSIEALLNAWLLIMAFANLLGRLTMTNVWVCAEHGYLLFLMVLQTNSKQHHFELQRSAHSRLLFLKITFNGQILSSNYPTWNRHMEASIGETSFRMLQLSYIGQRTCIQNNLPLIRSTHAWLAKQFGEKS